MRAQPQEARTACVVVQELLDEIDVREHHAAAAISLERELVERVALRVVGAQQTEVRLPLVGQHFAAREAADRDDHLVSRGGVSGQSERLVSEESH